MTEQDDRLAQIRARIAAVEARATTPAPGYPVTGRWGVGAEPREDIVPGLLTYEVGDCNGPYLVAHALDHAAAEFIASAREDIPYLLSEVERGRAVIEAARRHAGETLARLNETEELIAEGKYTVAAAFHMVRLAAVRTVSDLLPEERSDA